jgi:hypothetical protein
MQGLRRHRMLARFALAWFVLWLGVAVLSPAVAGSGLQVVCSGGSMKLAFGGDGAASELPSHVMHCPACAPALGAPPPVFTLQLQPPGKPAVPASTVASAATQTLFTPGSARGPPSLS